MKILGVESSGTSASCAVLENGRVLASAVTDTGLTHSQTLVPMIGNMLHSASLSLSDIGLLAAAHGPGSFTGVRIGVSVVKGMAMGANIPCAGVSSLAAAARIAGGMMTDAIVCAAMDARRNQVYTALFLLCGGVLTRLTDDDAVSVEEACAKIRAAKIRAAQRNDLQDGAEVIVIGDGALLIEDACRAAGMTRVFAAPPHMRFQSAVGVALEAEASGAAMPASRMRPVYLRLPQAERELKAKK